MKRSIFFAIVLVVGMASPGAGDDADPGRSDIPDGTYQPGISDVLNYQGVLTDAGGTAVPDRDYQLTFRIYDVYAGGTDLWEETHANVPVTKGIFNVILGSKVALDLPFDDPYYLGISVEGEMELTPRIPLTAAAYAFTAKGVLGDDNVFPSSGLVGIGTLFPGYPLDIVGPSEMQVGLRYNGYNSLYSSIYVNATQPTSRPTIGYLRGGMLRAMTLFDTDDHFRIRIDGTSHLSLSPAGYLGVGVSLPSERLDISGGLRLGSTTNNNAGTIRWTGSDFEGYNGSSWQSLTGGGSGSLPPGVFGQTLRHDGADWTATSNIYNDGTSIGIGTTLPEEDVHLRAGGTAQLRVETVSPTGKSDIELKSTGGASDYMMLTKHAPSASGTTVGGSIPVANLSEVVTGSTAGPLLLNVISSNPIHFATNNYERMRLDANGSLGINTTTPNAALHVGGSVKIGTDIHTGSLDIYRSTAVDPMISFSTSSGGGDIYMYDETGSSTIALTHDGNGAGGYLYVKRDPTYTAFRVDGNYNGTGSPIVSIFGGSASASFNMGVVGNTSVQLPGSSVSSSEIENEAGVASYEEGAAGVYLDSAPAITIIASQSITVPTAGYVLVIATCQARIDHDFVGDAMSANFGVSDNSSVFPTNQDVTLSLDADLPTGLYDFPVTCTGLFEASAGTSTFYFLGTETDGLYMAYDRQLSLVFIPTAYGTVEPTVAGAGEDVAGEPMTDTELAAQRAASIEANMARMERELDELRAQFEALNLSPREEE